VEDGKRVFAEDAAVRTACVHVVGDREGNIGTDALRLFAKQLNAYNAVTGLAEDGGTVTLSVDAALQTEALAALSGRAGAVALMDYRTGEVLCMVSSPAFDPDAGIDETDKRYDGAYLNRCISAAYPPGSVFKLVTLAAALETVPDLYERRFDCTGSTVVDGNTIKCTGVHGSQTIEQALANSCNCAFAELSLELGADRLAACAQRLGLTDSLSLCGASVVPGSFEKAAAGSADLAWSGIGQYTDLVSPYAVLRLSAAIAGGGSVREPTLLRDGKSRATAVLDADIAEEMADLMRYNVVSHYGDWIAPGLPLCAKTGTAELGDGTSHAWFTGFLQDEAHPYAFVVVVEHGGSGLSAAAPVASRLLLAAAAD
jgi:peptidoglycan glycosyltransferase